MFRLSNRALQVHPRNAGLWIMAASWEFETNNNTNAARVLLQRALRVNKHVKQLWIEYFRMEMLYVSKLNERRKMLGLKSPSTSGKSTKNPLVIPTLDAEREADSEASDEEDEMDESAQAKKAFLEGVIPKIVFNKASAGN